MSVAQSIRTQTSIKCYTSINLHTPAHTTFNTERCVFVVNGKTLGQSQIMKCKGRFIGGQHEKRQQLKQS